MANAAVNLTLTNGGYVKKSNPYTVFKTNTNTEYRVSSPAGDEFYLFFLVSKIPSNLRHNVLIGAAVKICARFGAYQTNTLIVSGCGTFDPNTLTYNNKPATNNFYIGISSTQSGNLQDVTFHYTARPEYIQELLRGGAVRINSKGSAYSDVDTSGTKVKTVLANGSSLPLVTITYDDAAKIKSKVSYNNSQLSGTINNAVAKTLTWDLVEDTSAVSGYCADPTWNQASAVFKYRKAGESTWLTRNVSGNTKSITIPANTFQSGSSYEYQITVTDEDGTVSSTSVYTFATATTKVTPSNAPTSGYANPRDPISFSWVYQSTAGGTVASGATTLHWRVSGDETWNDVQAAAGINSLTIPANTFPTASTIQWYLSGSDSTGYASQTSTYSFSTAAGLVRATAISPSNTIESNNQPITFKWSYSSPDGFEPTRYKFLWKLVTDEDYTVLRDSTDVVNEYTFPAYTFPAGEIKWGVNAYNIDGVPDVGYIKTFISYGAPAAPVVYAEAVPFTTVEWQADDQQAYQIKVDDVIYGPYFGEDKSFEIPDYLEDGEHIIGVSVVGTYGLWSAWGEQRIDVLNDPGEAVSLDSEACIDIKLFIDTQDTTKNFLIYRDGVQIAKTNKSVFTDRFALGEHTYKVVNKLENGNYTASNEVVRFSCVKNAHIALLSGGEWLEIKYTLKSNSDPEYEDAVEITYNHLAGSDYPSAVISQYLDKKVKYSAVFLFNQADERKTFESMFKKPVIIKFADGTLFAGILDSWSKHPVKKYYTSYTFTVTRTDIEDYVDDTK